MDQNGSIQMQSLYSDSCTIIEQAREQAYRAVNKALTIRNWSLGQRIAREHLGEDGRAEYGKHIIESLAEMLTDKYGKGFDQSSLYKYVRFYTLFPEILDALSPQSQKVDAVSQRLLPWTHYRELIRVDDPNARKWYEEEALREMWSTRTLHRNITSQYYFRLLQSPAKENVKEEMHRITAPFQQDKLEFVNIPSQVSHIPPFQGTAFL